MTTHGRLVFPAADSLVQAAISPFPRVAVAVGRCGGCGASGVGYATAAVGSGGFNARHQPGCPVLLAEQASLRGRELLG